jgi:hypothetical protein
MQPLLNLAQHRLDANDLERVAINHFHNPTRLRSGVDVDKLQIVQPARAVAEAVDWCARRC